MRNLFAAIGDALWAVFSAGRWVLKTTAKGAVWAFEAPIQLLGGMLRGGGGAANREPDERDVAIQAARQAKAEQAHADGRSEVDVRAQCVLRIVRALRDGHAPDPADGAALTLDHTRYLLGLTRAELEVFAQPSLGALKARRAFVENGATPEGCRSQDQFAADALKRPMKISERCFRSLADKIRAKQAAAEPQDIAALVRKHAAS